MTSVHSSTTSFTRPVRPFASGAQPPRKNSMMSVASPALSSFAIDLISQFDAYRTNMRENLRREVEENIHKAMMLKEALKESSELEAELAMAAEQQQQQNYRNRSTGNLSNTRGNNSSSSDGFQTNSPTISNVTSVNSPTLSTKNGLLPHQIEEKRSRLDKLFGRKSPLVTATTINGAVGVSTGSKNQVTPQGKNGFVYNNISQQYLNPGNKNNGNRSSPNGSDSAMDLKYLAVDEENGYGGGEDLASIDGNSGEDDIEIMVVGDRSAPTAGTEIKLHPSKAKVFTLPKSLRKLKHRIAALRAKGVDLDKEKNENQQQSQQQPEGEKRRFNMIRLLPWRSTAAKKPVAV